MNFIKCFTLFCCWALIGAICLPMDWYISFKKLTQTPFRGAGNGIDYFYKLVFMGAIMGPVALLFLIGTLIDERKGKL